MRKLVLIIIIGLIILPFGACKRDSFSIPEFSSPSTLDYYVLIDVAKTVLNPGNTTSLRVKVVGVDGKPIGRIKVKLGLRKDGSATSASQYAYLKSTSVETDSKGVAKTTLVTRVVKIYYPVEIKIVAWVGNDPIDYSNRSNLTTASVYIVPNF